LIARPESPFILSKYVYSIVNASAFALRPITYVNPGIDARQGFAVVTHSVFAGIATYIDFSKPL
jgi:hypothetical protein